MTIYITVEQTYMNQVTGRCGTYTGRTDGKRLLCGRHCLEAGFPSLDDMELPDGSLSSSVTNFCNEWRTDSGVSDIRLQSKPLSMLRVVCSVQPVPCQQTRVTPASCCPQPKQPADPFAIPTIHSRSAIVF